MRWLPLLIFPLLWTSAFASSPNRKPKATVRLYSEASAMDTEKFSTAVTLQYPPRKAFLNKIPNISEYDVLAVHPFRAPNGSMGCAFRLDPHGALALDTLSTESRGKSAVIFVNGRQVIDLLIDKRITDGILTIPFGLTESEIEAILNAWPPKKKKFRNDS